MLQTECVVAGSSLPGHALWPQMERPDCHGRCPVGGHLTESDLWEAMLDGDVTHGWMAWVGVGSWMENDRNYTTSLTCTNTPHSRGARKQAHLHRGDGSVMDSLLISGRLHCQPSQQRERTTIEGHPTRGCTTALTRSCAAGETAEEGRPRRL